MPRVRDEEEEWETKLERGTTPSGQPTRVVAPLSDIGKERPAVAGTRTESWVQTGREGQEAPNGGSVVQHS